MSLQKAKFELLRARNELAEEQMQSSILERWSNNALNTLLDRVRESPTVRILIYIDGSSRFSELTHIRTLLESEPYPYISFKVTSAHRDDSQSETRRIDKGPVKLTDLNILEDYDEIWFFGADGSQRLAQAEIDLLTQFMQAPKCGGVLVTGDHKPLGRRLAETIPRAGAMRLWDAPVLGPERNSSLVEGPDDNESFSGQDEADDRPQTINYRRFPIDAPSGVRLQPHPVLCGLDGPIDVLPDHEHEGEALAPQVNDGNESIWPRKDGHQEQPVVIAWGHVKDPQVHFKQFGVISVYNGHTVDRGRIVADSSWHHWVNSNLRGFEPTSDGQAALKKIEAYFLNCGAWLAPPEVQRQARNTAWWSIMWKNEVIDIPPDAPLAHFGERAIKELRRLASSCAVSEWVLGPVTFNNALSDWRVAQISERSSLLNLSVEQFIAGGILRALMNQVGPFNPEVTASTTAPSDTDLERAINDGTAQALSTLQEQLDTEAQRLQSAVKKLRLN